MKYRSISPSVELKPGRSHKNNSELSHYNYICRPEKIHRIRCRQGFYGIISEIISPSEIWIRPINHIAERLIIPTKDAPALETNLKPDVYVMAPINKDTLVRARIVHYIEHLQHVLLRLIDSGKLVWRDANAVFEMPNDRIRSHPWQAIHISLFGVNPDDEKGWSNEEIQNLKQILYKFECFYVMPTIYPEFLVNDDNEPVRASLNGVSTAQMYDKESRKRNAAKNGININVIFNYPNTIKMPSVPKVSAWDQACYGVSNPDVAFETFYERFDIVPREKELENSMKAFDTSLNEANSDVINNNIMDDDEFSCDEDAEIVVYNFRT